MAFRTCVRLAAVLSLASGPARAQGFEFADDFEMPGFPSPFSTVTSSAQGSISLTSAAAHRGDAGMRITLNTTASGTTGPSLSYAYPASGGQSIYFRAWARMGTPVGTGTANIAALSGGGAMACDLSLSGFLNEIQLEGPTSGTPLGNLASGTWYLIEMSLGPGFGTLSGAVEGVQTGTLPLVSFPPVKSMSVGAPTLISGPLSVVVDLDDVRTSAAPLASTLVLASTGSSWQPYDCIPLSVTLVDSFQGQAAPAPYDVLVTLDADGGTGTFYAGTVCSLPLATLVIAAGTTSAGSFMFQPSQGGVITLTASHVDFLSGPLALNVLSSDGGFRDAGAPDAGGSPTDGGVGLADGGRRLDAGIIAQPDGGLAPRADLGCGCGPSSSAPSWLALFVLATLLSRVHREPHVNRGGAPFG